MFQSGIPIGKIGRMNPRLNILIIEDEPLAAAQLAALLAGIRPEAKILAVCDTIASSVTWIENNNLPDLAFVDIHLGDGLSFDIFKKTNFNAPVIFTTAYDQYTLQAFKVNSIDYLLKPLDSLELKNALEKFEEQKMGQHASFSSQQMQALIQSVSQKNYKKRFLVKVGNHLKAINTSEILFFYSYQKGTFLKSSDGKDYLLDNSLEVVEQCIDPDQFFRINRKYIVCLDAINDVSIYSNSRLKLKVKHGTDNDFLVARERVKAFKNWLEGEND